MYGIIMFTLGCSATYIVMTNPEIALQVGDMLSVVADKLKE